MPCICQRPLRAILGKLSPLYTGINNLKRVEDKSDCNLVKPGEFHENKPAAIVACGPEGLYGVLKALLPGPLPHPEMETDAWVLGHSMEQALKARPEQLSPWGQALLQGLQALAHLSLNKHQHFSDLLMQLYEHFGIAVSSGDINWLKARVNVLRSLSFSSNCSELFARLRNSRLEIQLAESVGKLFARSRLLNQCAANEETVVRFASRVMSESLEQLLAFLQNPPSAKEVMQTLGWEKILGIFSDQGQAAEHIMNRIEMRCDQLDSQAARAVAHIKDVIGLGQ